jgi:hypothetical protein
MLLQTGKKILSAIALPVGIGLVLQGSVADAAPGADEASMVSSVEVSFATDVKPILDEYCVSCHGGPGDDGEPRVELGFNLATYEGLMVGSEYGSVIEVGDPENSLFLEMIVDGDMPEDGDPLPADKIEILRMWIAEGALNN